MRTIVFIFLMVLLASPTFSQKLVVTNLKCEYKENPLGLESNSPILSWWLKSNERSVLQTAYRILVSDDKALLEKNIGNIWDSKKISSDQSIQVKFQGKKLLPTETYFWKVMVWDNKNHASSWSDIAQWQMGLIEKKDWLGAQWIAFEKIPDTLVDILPADGKKDTYRLNNTLPMLRKDFKLSGAIKKATMFICGLGQFELRINGKKIGDHFLDPGWTKYDKQALYVPFDVTPNLQVGSNTIGVMLGNGFYYIPPVSRRYRKLKVAFGYPKMISRLVVEYADGRVENIVSDTTWKTYPSPITFSSIYGGEDHHARLEHAGWDEPGFRDFNWYNVVVVDGPPVLNAQMAEPLKVMEVFQPIKKFSLSNATEVYDLGQNASGIVQIKVKGNKGDTIRIIPGELLNADTTVKQRSTGSPYYWEYILKGEGEETWAPRFSYYGFRYVQVNKGLRVFNVDSVFFPTIIELSGLHTRNSANKAGSFSCSNELFNKTYKLIDRAIQSNMASVFTDCPHREKLGWLEQAHLMGNSIRYNYDVMNLYRKQILDMKYSQTADGLVPEIAPEFVKFEWGDGMFRDSPEWGSNAIITPWHLYKWYGDVQILEDSYPMMKRYIEYLQTKAKDNVLYQGLGDWYDLGPKPPGVSQLTPMGITGTATYYYDLNIIGAVARLLGKDEDATRFEQLAPKVKAAFNSTFFDKANRQYGTGSQTANAMAVFMNLVEPEDRDAVIENIIKDIRARNNSLTAGDIGYHYLLSVLHEAGRDDVIFDMNSRTDVLGYGYQLSQGATALTESWQALPTVSNNHLMLGHLMEWFYAGLAGIRQSEGSIGFKHVVIDPRPVGNIANASAKFESPYGIINSEWKKQGNNFDLTVDIPANSQATLILPAGYELSITENGKSLRPDTDIRRLKVQGGKAMVEIGSGIYKFSVKENTIKE